MLEWSFFSVGGSGSWASVIPEMRLLDLDCESLQRHAFHDRERSQPHFQGPCIYGAIAINIVVEELVVLLASHPEM